MDENSIHKGYIGKMTAEAEQHTLKGRNLCKSWGGTIGLRNVSIDVKQGAITTLIGPSGSGKTTLLRTLSLLDTPDSGAISIDHKTYAFPLENGKNPDHPWPDVTVVFQQLFLWPHLRLRENIMLPLKNRNNGFSLDELDDIIHRFDMESFIDRYPNEASLGQRQRVALVRALALRPSYILLDEITSALDVENVSAILTQLEKLRDDGIGVLMVTHLLGFARRAADRVAFLDNGSILEEGDRGMIDNPTHERVRHFLALMEAAT